MAIKLRANTATNTGKGSELTYLEMDTNLESFYYSSSLAGGNLTLFTTGSVSHTIALGSATGAQGAPGNNGAQGAPGNNGNNGAQGAEGAQGAPGNVAAQGAQGAPGNNGAQGAPGNNGNNGAQGAASNVAGPQGAQGAASNVAGPQGAQGTASNVAGPQGAQGAASSYVSNHTIVETLDNDIVIFIDSNSGTNPAYERIINDASGTGLPDLDDINGRTILIDQANATEGTLRFGFGNWTGTAGRRTFIVDIYNRGADTFLIGAFVPTGTWKIYLQGHDNGGGDRYQTYDTSFTGNDTFYGPHGIREGAYAKLFYDYTLKVVVIWCSSWTGTLGGSGNTNL